MTNSFDHSHKDKMYFIDDSIYNCPFCKRRNVSYFISDHGEFNTTPTKTTYFYLARCESCDKTSFHLSNYDLVTYGRGQSSWGSNFAFPPKHKTLEVYEGSTRPKEVTVELTDKDGKPRQLDELFYYHQPSAAFTIDERIPATIREPLSEADSCLKSNFLTGASAALRKAIYKLLQHESIVEKRKTKFLKHDERIELLKKKHPKTDGNLLNKLKSVHVLTSQELHENDWQDFNGQSLRFLLEITREALSEMYVLPDVKMKRDKELSDLEAKAKGKIDNKASGENK